MFALDFGRFRSSRTHMYGIATSHKTNTTRGRDQSVTANRVSDPDEESVVIAPAGVDVADAESETARGGPDDADAAGGAPVELETGAHVPDEPEFARQRHFEADESREVVLSHRDVRPPDPLRS